jgi:hypothetical protein
MSIIKVDTLQTITGDVIYPARVWVNFDGTGTVAIRADGNVSSITDSGLGQYQANFSVNTIDGNYAAMSNMKAEAGSGNAQTACLIEYDTLSSVSVAMQTSSVRVSCIANDYTLADSIYVGINIVR